MRSQEIMDVLIENFNELKRVYDQYAAIETTEQQQKIAAESDGLFQQDTMNFAEYNQLLIDTQIIKRDREEEERAEAAARTDGARAINRQISVRTVHADGTMRLGLQDAKDGGQLKTYDRAGGRLTPRYASVSITDARTTFAQAQVDDSQNTVEVGEGHLSEMTFKEFCIALVRLGFLLWKVCHAGKEPKLPATPPASPRSPREPKKRHRSEAELAVSNAVQRVCDIMHQKKK